MLESLAGGLIVSCQAGEGDPLHGPHFMAEMAKAAYQGGARGIRANGAADIRAIRQAVPLPIVGIVKRHYPGSPVYITPTLAEALEVLDAGADVAACDATARPRPGGWTLERLVEEMRARSAVPLMADVSSVEEGVRAARLGFDVVATTLVGYAGDHEPLGYRPDFALIERMVAEVTGRFGVPVIVEGHIWEPDQARRCLELGAFAVVVGTAITRPQLITRRFVEAMGRRRTDQGEGGGHEDSATVRR
ncbi:N-acetylmannosamine-6-phosphate 2-epimerase [Carboxydichorda subterranea]|uniref:N-acetylmannosamine-6-phosphate 2-epimerase n=1 Tax=Carboxydichorda subterranea TaxID=3109565 RepID=UPI0038578AE0